jgi:hypothetical protein
MRSAVEGRRGTDNVVGAQPARYRDFFGAFDQEKLLEVT